MEQHIETSRQQLEDELNKQLRNGERPSIAKAGMLLFNRKRCAMHAWLKYYDFKVIYGPIVRVIQQPVEV